MAKRMQHDRPAANARVHERLSLLEERAPHVVQKPRAAVGQIRHTVHVEHEAVRIGRELHQVAHHVFGAVESDVALQCQAFDLRGEQLEARGYGGPANASRRRLAR